MIKFLLESYENMTQVSTVNRELPKIQITVAPDFKDDVLMIIEDLKNKFFMQQLDEDATTSQGLY